MILIALVTLGVPAQLTGGYLYHRRMADAAAEHGARIDFVAARWSHNPLSDGADVVLVDSIAAAVAAPWSRCRRSSALAAILHQPPGGIDGGGLHRTVQARLDRHLYRNCVLLIAASEDLGEQLVAEHELPAERIVVIPPGRDVADAAVEAPELHRGRRVAFLSVGNWVARKGTLELLDAFAALPPELATLHLAGRDDLDERYTAQVRRRLADPRLAGRVVVHGAVSPNVVADLYHGADVFVLPSTREPYGTVYGEALAAGLPVVGWRAGNLPNLARDGVEGFVLEPHDIPALSSALRTLATDDARRDAMGRNALRRGSLLPTWDDTAKQFFTTIGRLAAER